MRRAVVVSARAKQLKAAAAAALVLAAPAPPAGARARGAGCLLSAACSARLLGAVLGPLGLDLSRAAPPGSLVPGHAGRAAWLVEGPAPALLLRRGVSEPAPTGLLCLDALVPVGRGQRELVLGDRKAGKTSAALDTTLSQEGEGAARARAQAAAPGAAALAFAGALAARGGAAYALGAPASAFDAAALQHLGPYSAAAAGEFFAWAGQLPALAAFDDLSRHAVAYRELALLLGRPPAREAYPGEIFFPHSRLLERGAKLGLPAGGGSLTALPVVETLAGEVSAFVPTNAISITDGQVLLSLELLLAGARPGLDAGLSVTRVGSAAQWPGARSAGGPLKLAPAQHAEMQAFAALSADLGAGTRAALARGERLAALLAQAAGSPRAPAAELALLGTSLAPGPAAAEAGRLAALGRGLARLPDWALGAAPGRL